MYLTSCGCPLSYQSKKSSNNNNNNEERPVKKKQKSGETRQAPDAGESFLDEYDDNFDDDDGYYGDELETLRTAMASSRRVQARRAIELAREELALKRALEDYPDY
jgi:hypothetical protein